jgi:cytochrome b561
MDDATTLPAADAARAYDAIAIALHWVLAMLIAVAFFIGLSMVDLPFSPQRFRFFNWHKWLGIAVLAMSAGRLLWRAAGHPPPPVPAGMPAWQLAAFRATHALFYALFFAVPLLGWAYTSAVGVPVVFLGWLPLPDFVPRDKALGDEILKPLHAAASYLLAAIVVVHVAAALKHHYLARDGLLLRMWPWWPSRRRA